MIRGARQVGKSYLVREFGKDYFEHFLEINFERDPGALEIFASRDPRKACQMLEAKYGIAPQPGLTLLFLDEIQAAPEVFANLRYFYEELPGLHIIAAGSLLDFVLREHTFSMPVGRIEYLHLGPMSYEEYLLAKGKDRLLEWLSGFHPGQEMPVVLHEELLGLLREFLVVGGMPAAVAAFLPSGSCQACDRAKESILATFRDDFGKYGPRTNPALLAKVFARLPFLVGNKFKYSHVDREVRSSELGQALERLCLARVAAKVRHSSCNGIPLGAEADDRAFKVLFLDVGLMVRAAGLGLADFERAGDPLPVNAGAVCEQFVGQQLLHSRPWYEEPAAHYWIREKANAGAEVDYVLSEGERIVPVEVKAGKSGTLKSLHLFLREKGRDLGVRLNADPPSLATLTTALPDGENRRYRLLSLPLYLAGQVRRLVREL